MTRFELMSEEEARRIVEYTRRSIDAHLAGGVHSDNPKVRAEARLVSLQSETYDERAAAKRRLAPVVSDEERRWLAVFRAAEASGACTQEAARQANLATGRVSVQRRGHVR